MDNPQAFPLPYDSYRKKEYQGMTLRDYFAGQALSGMLGDSVTIASVHKVAERNGVDSDEGTAISAYEIADAMLKERGK